MYEKNCKETILQGAKLRMKIATEFEEKNCKPSMFEIRGRELTGEEVLLIIGATLWAIRRFFS